MGRQPGFTETQYPVPDALESVGAAHNVAAHGFAEQGRRELAIVHSRLSRSYWRLAQEERERMREAKKSGLPATNEKAA